MLVGGEMKGIIAALLCSFDKSGKVNEEGIKKLVRFNIENGVDGLYVNGSTGENFMLSTEEKKLVFKAVKEEAGNEIPLIAQIGSLNINEAIELGKYATELGYDYLSAVTPFYYKFSFDEIKDYYNTILEEVDNKMIIYSVPILTGSDISLENFKELFENPKIVGVKFTQSDFYMLERLRSSFPKKMIFSGFDEMLLPAAALGIDGAIGSTFNINAKRAKGIIENLKSGNLEKAKILQKETNDFIQEVLSNGLYQTLKLMLEEKGIPIGECRRPMRAFTETIRKNAREISRKYF